MDRYSSRDANKLTMCFLLIGCNVMPKCLHCSRTSPQSFAPPLNPKIICTLMIKVNYTAPKKFLLNFQNSQMKKRGETLFGECRCNYGERQWEIGYAGIQNRYVASIGKVRALHDWIPYFGHGVNQANVRLLALSILFYGRKKDVYIVCDHSWKVPVTPSITILLFN